MYLFLKHKKLVALLILLVIGLAIYGNSFNNEFFWDDDDSIVNNVYIKDWQYFDKYFTENLIAGSGQTTDYWRPVLLVSFAIDYHLWGLEPFGFHLTNTLLHILTAWLVFLLLYKLAKRKRNSRISPSASFFILPFLVSLFFLIHPLQTEAVTYAAGRADSLSGIFSLLAILFYVYYREKYAVNPVRKVSHISGFTPLDMKLSNGVNENAQSERINYKKLFYYFTILLFFILGLLTKEQVILLPALILLVELVFISGKLNRKSVVNVIKLVAPLFLISIIYFVMRLTAFDFNDLLHGFEYDANYNSSVYYRLLTFASVMVEYFKLLFAPIGLHMAREVAVVTLFLSAPVLIFVVILAIITVICVKTWHQDRMIAFGFLWFFIILLPRTNIWQINRPMYEHWLYLPMIGFWLALFSLLALIFQKIKKKQDKLALPLVYAGFTALVVCIFSFSALTVLRNNDWQNAITFYEKNLHYTPNSFIQHNNLGMAYADAGREREAVSEYEKAIAISDVYPQVHYNLSNSLRALSKTDEAIKEYKQSIGMSPLFILPYNNLLAIYLKQNDRKEIDGLLKKMEVIFKGNENFLYTKGLVYYDLGEFRQAVAVWRELLEIEPNDLIIKELINSSKNMIKNK